MLARKQRQKVAIQHGVGTAERFFEVKQEHQEPDFRWRRFPIEQCMRGLFSNYVGEPGNLAHLETLAGRAGRKRWNELVAIAGF